MNPKPNVLICGTSQFANSDLLSEATPAGTIPENTEADSLPSEPETEENGENGASDGKQASLIRRFIETPVANFIEANEITDLGEDELFPEGLSMRDYEKKVEAELHAGGFLPDDAGIDVIWYCAGSDLTFTSESEKDFIRSAAGVPNAIIVSSPMIFSKREDFRKEIDALKGLAGSRRIVLAPSASSRVNFMSISSGTRFLIEKTGWKYLEKADASDEEKKAFEAAWNEFYGKKYEEWQESLEDSLRDCIGQAAGRANFILNKPAAVPLTDLVEEGIDLLSELVDILHGSERKESRPRKRCVAHTAELKNNIELMLYEIAACYGRAADELDVDLILRHSKVSRLPGDAAAITYAVGQVAKAVYDPQVDCDSKVLLRVFRESMEEAVQMEFRPYDDDEPFAHLDDNFELDEADLDDADEPEDAGDTGPDGDAADGIHEPADELPDDCREDCAPESSGCERNPAGE